MKGIEGMGTEVEPKSGQREQRVYARWLAAGSRLTLGLLAATFVLYLSDLLHPLVPISELPRYWGMSAARYSAATGSPIGWHLLKFAAKPDIMNLVGIACVALVTPVCLARMVPEFLKRRDTAFAVIALMELLVLAMAASGLAAG